MENSVCIGNEFETLCRQWLFVNKYQYKQSTFALYTNNIEKYILPFFNNVSLSKLGEKDVNNFKVYLLTNGKLNSSGGLSVSTTNNILSVLYEILLLGNKENKISDSFKSLTIPHQHKGLVKIFSKKSWRILQAYLVKEETPICFGILLSMYTGIRIGELCSLQWGDISQSGILNISKTLLRIRNPNYTINTNLPKTMIIIDLPKTPSSVRSIPIPERILDISKKFSNDPSKYILTDTPKYMEPRRLQYKFKRVR